MTYQNFAGAVLNNNGKMAFHAHLDDNNFDTFTSASIWRVDDGVPNLVVRAGDRAPGFSDDNRFYYFGGLSINPAGQIAFLANVLGEGLTTSNENSVWVHDGESLRLITREGDPAPGKQPDVFFRPVR